MLKNNNYPAVKRVARRSMKHNRTRNLFAVLAIILTTFMFTTVFSVGFSAAENMSSMLTTQIGIKAQLFLTNPTEKQIEQAKKCSSFKHGGIISAVVKAYSTNNPDVDLTLKYSDNENFTYHIKPTFIEFSGNYPQQENEIMLSLNALDSMGITAPETGNSIALEINGETKTFILSGFFKDYSFRTNSYDAYISENFYNSYEDHIYTMFAMSAKKFHTKSLERQLNSSIVLDHDQGINSLTNSLEDNLIIAVMVLILCVIIIISGYLLIYNIMYISVTHDIKFYGMLKTIGTTPEQIQKIVKIQAFTLSIAGIPIGTILGVLASFIAVPLATDFLLASNNFSDVPTTISFNPFIYVGTVIFALITVSLSCRKPAKIAGKVSPVEAMKYNGISKKIKPHKSTGGGKLYKMAFRNVFREKKRAIIVFASILMGTLALFGVQTFMGGLKLENYADYYYPDDYAIFPDCSDDNNYEIYDDEKIKSAEKLADKIKNIDGVTKVMLNRASEMDLLFDKDVFMPFIEAEADTMKDTSVDEIIKMYSYDPDDPYYTNYFTNVVGVDSFMLERYNKRAERKIDISAFERGEVCLIDGLLDKEKAEQMTNKTITIINSETGKKRDIKIGLCLSRKESGAGLNVSNLISTVASPEVILVSQSVIDELTDKPIIEGILAECEPDSEAYVTNEIKSLTSNNSCIPSLAHVNVKSEILGDFYKSMSSINILVSGLSVILIMIGVINFINVMVTGVFTRRKELAVMESVGMTKKQVNKMLMYEGLYYGGITTGLVFTAGSALVYWIADNVESIIDYAIFYFPWQLMIAVSAIILIICIAVPAIIYKFLSKESITDRLRTE